MQNLKNRTMKYDSPVLRYQAVNSRKQTHTHTYNRHTPKIPTSQSYGIKIGYGAGAANQPGTIKPGETPQKSGGCCS